MSTTNNTTLDEDTAYDMAKAEHEARRALAQEKLSASTNQGDASVWTGNWVQDILAAPLRGEEVAK